MVSSATYTIIWWWLWLELSRAMPATIPPLFPLKGVWVFCSDQLIWWFLSRTAQRWVAWLAPGLENQEQQGQYYSWHHICHAGCPSMLSDPMSLHSFCSLGFAASWPAVAGRKHVPGGWGCLGCTGSFLTEWGHQNMVLPISGCREAPGPDLDIGWEWVTTKWMGKL